MSRQGRWGIYICIVCRTFVARPSCFQISQCARQIRWPYYQRTPDRTQKLNQKKMACVWNSPNCRKLGCGMSVQNQRSIYATIMTCWRTGWVSPPKSSPYFSIITLIFLKKRKKVSSHTADHKIGGPFSLSTHDSKPLHTRKSFWENGLWYTLASQVRRNLTKWQTVLNHSSIRTPTILHRVPANTWRISALLSLASLEDTLTLKPFAKPTESSTT